jgi:hypothetical protein
MFYSQLSSGGFLNYLDESNYQELKHLAICKASVIGLTTLVLPDLFSLIRISLLHRERRPVKIAGQLKLCGQKHYFVKGFLLRF